MYRTLGKSLRQYKKPAVFTMIFMALEGNSPQTLLLDLQGICGKIFIKISKAFLFRILIGFHPQA